MSAEIPLPPSQPVIHLDTDTEVVGTDGSDLLTLGQRIRHYRTARGMTLGQLGEQVGAAASQLSLVENGHREPRISLLTALAAALGVGLSDLLEARPPSRRAALEIALEKAQRGPLYARLGLPTVRASRTLPTEALESLVGLHAELVRRSEEAIATPQEARRATTELSRWMRDRDNYLPEIEDLAEQMLKVAGHGTGPLAHRTVARLASHLGFTLIHVDDLPHSTRTVTDLATGRIYLPPASIPGGHGLRSLALQAIAHQLLGHQRPTSYADFLRQRIEINYFAAACLLPRTPAVELLRTAKKNKDLAVEDFRDAFGVTHQTAAQRLTNLLTSHLGIPVHFMRVSDDGTLEKGYANDGAPFAADATGTIEGQPVCRQWAARAVFERSDRTTEFYQYTDTEAGTFWCTAQPGSTETDEYSITVGVPFAHAKWWRGRDTQNRRVSRCPDEACCRRPSAELAARWADHSWPSAAVHQHVLAPLPSGTFPGVDDSEVFTFLEKHAPRG